MTEIETKLKPLMLAALSGDNASYANLLTLLTRLLRAYFRKRMGANLDEVEDVIQEVLIAIHNQRHTFDAAYPVSAWAHGIARFKLLDFYRRHKQYVADHVDIDDAEDLMVAEDSEAHHCQRDVTTLLETLPEKQRHAIHCVKIEGHSIAEAAKLTKQSESSVKVNIHRGLKALALLMGAQHAHA